jgi:hypothetical protein
MEDRMSLSAEDHIAITTLIGRHGHLVDAGELRRLDELFTPDAVFDLSDFGAGTVEGLDALYRMADDMGDDHPVGHHVTNIVLTDAGDHVSARSKGIAVNADGSCGSVTYEDTVTARPEGWRITRRRILAHRRPLGRSR